MGLLKNGAHKAENFLSKAIVSKINLEMDELFASATINCSKGFIVTSKVVKSTPFPFVFVRSVNLLDLVVDVAEQFAAQGVDMKNFQLCELEVYNEIGDKNVLGWHTDGKAAGLLALIYLQGGTQSSGGSQYMKGTHLLDHGEGYHYLSGPEVSKRAESIEDLSGNPGDLVCYNLNGFHSRHPTNQLRRSIRILYAPKTTPKSAFDDVAVPLSLLTPRVLENLDSLLRAHQVTPLFSEIGEVSPNNFFVKPRYVGGKNLVLHFNQHMIGKITRRLKSFF